ncbi:hypothetical protein [Streptomyces sp. SID3343]|uniref:hypothetical protein n=1 Tax=Streptomyces sp. SID3343 TaxID=2690260 RepID=UPI00136AF70D|nr:hypothetical protein [Streptomyces sp. SID3343]
MTTWWAVRSTAATAVPDPPGAGVAEAVIVATARLMAEDRLYARMAARRQVYENFLHGAGRVLDTPGATVDSALEGKSLRGILGSVELTGPDDVTEAAQALFDCLHGDRRDIDKAKETFLDAARGAVDVRRAETPSLATPAGR